MVGELKPTMTPGMMLCDSYDYGFAVVSVVLAIVASYAALNLAGRVSTS